MCGFTLGALAQKLKLPGLVGNIAAGILVGPHGLELFSREMIHGFGAVTDFALCIFGFTMGTHLVLRQLHNAGHRIISILLYETILVPALIFTALYFGVGLDLPPSLLLAAIGLTTSPSTIIHIILHRRSKGIFTKTLITAVALNSFASLMLFSIAFKVALATVTAQGTPSVVELILAPARELFAAMILGACVALVLLLLSRRESSLAQNFSFLLIVLLLIAGICRSFQLPGFIASMVLGFVVANYSNKKEVLLKSFVNVEPGIYCLFFVLAGTHIDFGMLPEAGMAGVAFLVARSAGKYIAPTMGAYLSHASRSIKQWLGLALFPQAGVAIGLVMIIEGQPEFSEFSDYLTTVVLGSVVVCELIGPILTDLAVRKSGEVNKNQPRLLEFLQEEYVLVGLQETDKWKVLQELAAFMYKVHGVRDIGLDELVQSIVGREKQMSTGIGDGVAVPHGRIEGGPAIRGVIGISHQGIDFDSVDNQPVHVIILIVTPEAHMDQHLQILAAIAKIFGLHRHIKEHILKARTAAQVHEILQSGDADEVNVYLDE